MKTTIFLAILFCNMVSAATLPNSKITKPESNPIKQLQVPFSDAFKYPIFNYHRHRLLLATSGALTPDNITELKLAGFKTIVDLRTKKEGTYKEAKLVRQADINYHNIPVGKNWPSNQDMASFKSIIEKNRAQPTLLHCGSANRVGMMWAAYLIESGTDFDAAVTEGRTIGMQTAREKMLRDHFRNK